MAEKRMEKKNENQMEIGKLAVVETRKIINRNSSDKKKRKKNAKKVKHLR